MSQKTGKRKLFVCAFNNDPKAVGGLPSLMDEYLGELAKDFDETYFFGFSGVNNLVDDEKDRDFHRLVRDDGIIFESVDLTKQEYADTYLGLYNDIYWPSFHRKVEVANPVPNGFAADKKIMDVFAKRMIALGLSDEDDDCVSNHDYQNMGLGRALRNNGFEGPISFYLHIPAPDTEVIKQMVKHGLGTEEQFEEAIPDALRANNINVVQDQHSAASLAA
ncbi:MAG: trehalose 6-phosphate synthase, partial [Alphaproteobacteria bacterium]|nr:trehalose 6-phosphate synthase [Alphaproteobacteria bacterium]